MKIQQLTIHNIASIEDATIDFLAPPLADSEVFLITGITGAGKSTILDAICLALYANTPRMENNLMRGDMQEIEDTIKPDDVRQLMRRNTGEAWVRLRFLGSNSIPYEAEWYVQRAHRRATGRLQSKKWSLTNLQTNTSLTRDMDIRQEIQRAVGLDFEQFCRTTMLAQGEFTRFLNSNDNEKAEILEKITGVDDYSKIGAKIYAITKEKENAWRMANEAIENIRFLSDDEVATLEQERQTIETESLTLTKNKNEAIAKQQWLKTDADIKEKITKANDNLLVARQQVENDDFLQKEMLHKQWNQTIDARGLMKTIQDNDQQEKKQRIALIKLFGDYHRLLSGLKWRQQQVEELQRQAADYEPKNELLKTHEQELEQLRLPQLRQQKETLLTHTNAIETAQDRIDSFKKEQKKRADAQKTLEQLFQEIQNIEGQVTTARQEVIIAKATRDACETMYEKQRESVNKWAKSIRAKLHLGDVCPACQQPLHAELPSEGHLDELFAEVEETFQKSKQDHEKKDDYLKRLEANLKAQKEQYNRNKQQFDNDTSLADSEQRAKELCDKCGITFDNGAEDRLKEMLVKTTEETAALNNKISVAENKEKAIKAEQREVERLRQLKEQAQKVKDDMTNEQDAFSKIAHLMPEWQGEEVTEAVEMNNLLANVNQLYAQVQSAQDQIKSAVENREKAKNGLGIFLSEQPSFTVERLNELAAFSSTQIDQLARELQNLRNVLLAARTALGQLNVQQQEHVERRPALAENDSVESLATVIGQMEQELIDKGERRGAINQQLLNEQEKRKQLHEKREEAEEKKQVYEKWYHLNEMIGDASGSKFRKIAQSYVLATLIHSANPYMGMLTDRYTLLVEPGTFIIAIEDAYQGYVRRPASTISGGESFLVSLSLALALSDIGQQLSVDTLFIDEGFGTLSGEPLQQAIDTLRSLHNKSGRHVGVISHVEELRERIPTQIQVTREHHHSASIIQVVG